MVCCPLNKIIDITLQVLEDLPLLKFPCSELPAIRTRCTVGCLHIYYKNEPLDAYVYGIWTIMKPYKTKQKYKLCMVPSGRLAHCPMSTILVEGSARLILDRYSSVSCLLSLKCLFTRLATFAVQCQPTYV